MFECFAGVQLFLGSQQKNISNYAMIAGRDFAHRDVSADDWNTPVDGFNDGLWCQSAISVNGTGSWQLPNGSAAPVDPNPPLPRIYMTIRPNQVGLLRSQGIKLSPYQGMYICTIPDENEVTQTLVVWIAANPVYDGTDGNREFENLA